MFPLQAFEGGPPWSLSVEVYRQLLGGEFDEVLLRDVGEGRVVGGRKGEMLGVWRKRR